MKKNLYLLLVLICSFISCLDKERGELSGGELEQPKRIKVGVYYFGGWAGINPYSEHLGEDWAKNAPSHLTKKLALEFGNREPIWGWRDDSVEIMEKQIDLAADHGIEFFMFCWYWSNDKGAISTEKIDEISLHKCLDLYMKAKNRHRIKFGLLIANHQGAEIVGTENWVAATNYWTKYFSDKQYITIDDKPFIAIFNASGLSVDEQEAMQLAAKNNNLQGLSIAACGSAPQSKQYDYRTHYNAIPIVDNGGNPARNYNELVTITEREWVVTNQPYIPSVSVGWDPRPWDRSHLSERNQYYFVDNTPEKLEQSLGRAAEWIEANPQATVKEKMVMIYAWNEFGEGGYLVPTLGDKEGSHLQAIKNIVFSQPE